MKTVSLAAWILVVCLIPEASAHERDGLLIRMATGVGATVGETEASASGSFALGGSVATGLVVHGGLWGDGTALGVGPGLTYYLMPLNLYWSASWGLSESFDEAGEPITGWSAAHMVGKEWWVSDSWSLGFAGQLLYFDFDTDERWTLGALFSASYL